MRERLIRQLEQGADLPAALALVEGGVVTLAAGAAVAHDAPFQAASIAKSITAWAVMALVEQGRIVLDEPIWRYQRRFPPPAPAVHADGVTVRRIMCHTSGLGLADYPGHDPSRPHPGEAVTLFAEGGPDPLRLVTSPGAGFRYSGGGWTLIQLAVEEITGRPFNEHLRETVLQPLGMRDSGFASPCAALPQPRDAEGRPLPTFRHDALAAAGLYATAPDLARFLAAHRDGGSIISKDSLAMLLAPLAETGGVHGLWSHYGLGYEIEPLPDGRRLVGHAGINRGWRCRMAFLPDQAAGIAVLTAGDGGMALVDALLTNWAAGLSLSL